MKNKKVTKVNEAEKFSDTILGLVNRVKQNPPKIQSKVEIEDYASFVKIQEKRNAKIKKKIQSLKRQQKTKRVKDNILEQLRIAEDIKREQKQLRNIDHMKNHLNYISGKDFYYVVNDNFNKPYKVKRSQILKMQDNSLFIKKFEQGVKKMIKKLKENNPDEYQKKKIKILEEKLLKGIDYNKHLDQLGNKKIKDLTDEEGEELNEAEEAEETMEKPIPIDITSEMIDIH